MKISFLSRYNRPSPVGYEPGGPVLLETTGYISPKQMIENFILAGERLAKYRSENYDFQGNFISRDDDEVVPPERRPNFDLSDAHQMAQVASERLNEAKDRVMKKRAADKAAKAELAAKEKAELEVLRAKNAQKMEASSSPNQT